MSPNLKSVDQPVDPICDALSKLSLKKCWQLADLNSEPVDRIQFVAVLLCGDRCGPRAERALAHEYRVSQPGAAKWLNGDGLPKQDLNWFFDVFTKFEDDKIALLIAFDDFMRGAILHDMRKALK